jgi:hypothetical protein
MVAIKIELPLSLIKGVIKKEELQDDYKVVIL